MIGVMDRLIGLTLAVLVFGLVGCSSDPDVAEEAAPALPVLFDNRSAVMPPETVWDDGGTPDPDAGPGASDEAVAAVLATIDSHPDLAWGADHVRFVGRSGGDDDGELRALLSCDAETLSSPEHALQEFRNALGILGGGDCYGSATFTADGELIDWRTNGES